MTYFNLSSANEFNPARKLAHDPSFQRLIFVTLHFPLGLGMRFIPLLSTLHAIVILVLGVIWASSENRRRRVPYLIAYITGAEILWRMTDAKVFWEFGKYATVTIIVVYLLRQRSWKLDAKPLIYFVLLIPSILLTIDRMGFSKVSRDQISFNLSGPLALMLCVVFLGKRPLGQHDLVRIVWATIAPIVAVLTLAVYSTLTIDYINFTNESNFITSGSFGPNQVSAIFGLGYLFLTLYIFQEDKLFLRIMAFLLSLALIVQSVLTFSRGGLYNVIFSILIAGLHYVRRAKFRTTFLLLSLILWIVAVQVYPSLDQITGGMLNERFTNFNLSYRFEIAEEQVRIWTSYPLFGVGPGMAKYEGISSLHFAAAAHSEYTRLLAEHGIAGAIAISLLLIMSFRFYKQAPSINAKAWVAALLAWTFVEMSHSAMRMVAVPFLFGLASADWRLIKDQQGIDS